MTHQVVFGRLHLVLVLLGPVPEFKDRLLPELCVVVEQDLGVQANVCQVKRSNLLTQTLANPEYHIDFTSK